MPEEQRAQEANAARVERLLAAARPHWRCERKGMLQARTPPLHPGIMHLGESPDPGTW